MSADFTITAISWDRVHLTIVARLHQEEGAEPPQFAIATPMQVRFVDAVPRPDGQWNLHLNVTNFQDRKQIPEGTWRIVEVIDNDGFEAIPADRVPGEMVVLGQAVDELIDGAEGTGDGTVIPRRVVGRIAGYDLARVNDLDQTTRAFIYDGNKVSYTISFGISEEDDPQLLMRVYQFFRKAKASGPVIKPTVAQRARKRVLPQARRVRFANRWYALARRVNPPTGKRILFASEMRSRMEGNLLSVHDRMVERGLDRDWEIRTSFRVPDTASKLSTLRLIYLLATSDIVMIDDYFGVLGALNISPNTKIVQAWHAGSGFKSIGFSRFGNYGSPKLQNAHRKYTYAITGSTHLVPVYAEAFGIEERAVIPTGLPRIDTFLDADRTARVVADFFAANPALRGKKLILFAPTFRGRGVSDAYYEYSRLDFDKLYEMCGEEYVVLFRMHHFIDEQVSIPAEYADRLKDFTSFPDTNDLLHVIDILITDYSSIIYEFSLLDRPMLFFGYDKEVYSATRGFHRDYDLTAPGKVCVTFDELIEAIQTEDFELEKIAAFRKENFDVVDTSSADRVIDMLILSDPLTSQAAGVGDRSEQVKAGAVGTAAITDEPEDDGDAEAGGPLVI